MPIPGVPPWIGDLDHLDGLDEAALATDTTGQIIFANSTARRRHRFVGDDLARVDLAESLLAPHEREAFTEVERQALGGRHWAGRLDVVRVDGSVRGAELSCSPLRRDGAVVGMVCVVDELVSEHGQDREVRRLGDRLTRLARVAAELGTAEDVETVTKVVVSQAADAVGATVASLSLVVGENTLALVGLRGGPEGASQRWATYSVDDDVPAAEVVRTGVPLVLVGREAIDERFPDLERATEGERSIVCLPMRVVGRAVGVITLSFPGRRELDGAELEFFGILADSCAQALERIRAQAEATEQALRVRFLADATTELAKSLDYEVTLANVARLAVPTFADWCAIDVVEDDRLHRLAVEHVDPAKVRFALEIQERYPSNRDAPGGAWDVIRTGRSSLIPEVTDEMLVAAAVDEEHLRIARELHLRSAMTVPLVARGRSLGVITFVAAESERRYAPEDVAFAEDLGRRAAIAIDNAQLHSQTREAAVRLQHAVLPDLAVNVSGWELASHYSPAGRTDVGGDFYDAIGLPDGRLVLFVGDVMGRGVGAAAAMAQMRAAVRAYVAVDPQPEVVLRKLDLLFATYGMSQLVTLVYALADPSRNELVVVNAGHPPPLVLREDGAVEELPTADGPPLGISDGPRHTLTVPLRSGDTVLAFTDGLIERRAEDIDEGQRRVREAAPGLVGEPLGQALERLVESVRDLTREDDVAVLAARRVPGGGP
ncbi:SpoIIE family protein phosphatase [Nocardioides sp. MAHUQ-72]|uniref:SpoIIE family protein phosphatase n=1 Tax=unclassified Nocardioides TaxID=2615069 RepID=UPI0036155E61